MVEHSLTRQVATNVRAHLERHAWDDAAAARALDVTPAQIRERREGTTPWTLVEIDTLAVALGTSPALLLCATHVDVAEVSGLVRDLGQDLDHVRARVDDLLREVDGLPAG
ncbi:helix-turn-helix domain-containing protein [Nocardioides sp. AX2bis]|uniref:helix-turn-helix domain-containing protein n=1 Tax=Nocardioides sp. AX2bis TaxID=2653157 RepID=UPI0012EF33DD|nr:helix-turn-helix domain-containing protein [Nocardioides sp. AX2bis]VXC16754.1 hypothetical protein NOCARDAX2BIS_460072 [Nocardioides sp. AX2bis]